MFDSYYRAAFRQLNDGIDGGDLCVPCQKAFIEEERAGFACIGTPTWLNNGYKEYEGYEHLTEPILYCDCCRHVLRAREFQRRQGEVQGGPLATQEPAGDFDGLTTSVFLHDDNLDLKNYEASLDGFKVGTSEHSRTVRHHWADVEMIKHWFSDCEYDHGDVCNQHRRSFTETGSLLLLDVINDCLTVGKFTHRYFALSYVWGASKQYLTLAANYHELCEYGSLSLQPLAQTIKDSMTFVKNLGERYLWVDTMCIIQDDADNKANALAQMCSIYSCAVATIVALSGNSADAGLPGIPPTARNTNATLVTPGLHMVERSSLERMLRNHTYDYVDADCVYNTRAWTFQERLLSNRSIYFLGEQVYFHCKKHLLCEDRYVSDDTDFYTLEKMRTLSAGLKTKTTRAGTYSPLNEFRWYEQIAVEYTAKRMQFPDDIINAFTGIQTELGRMFDWSFVAGLPSSLLEVALLWTPVTTIERRITVSQLPSWSWSGWIGRVRYADLVRPGHRPISSLFRPLGTRNLGTPGTIQFESMGLILSNFELVKAPKGLLDPFGSSLITEDSYYVFDSRRRRCGILIGLSENDEISSRVEDFRLIALSLWKSNNSLTKHGPLIAHLSNDGNRSDEDLYDRAFRDAEWCTYNIMLVRSVGVAYERVAVGQMHVDAWSEIGETWARFTVQ